MLGTPIFRIFPCSFFIAQLNYYLAASSLLLFSTSSLLD